MEEKKSEENKLEEFELKEKIISKKTKNLLKNYVLTIINNKNDVNQNLKSEDINIILSSGNGRKKKIFSSLSIVNSIFDAKTYSKKNEDKFNELRNLIQVHHMISLQQIFQNLKKVEKKFICP